MASVLQAVNITELHRTRTASDQQCNDEHDDEDAAALLSYQQHHPEMSATNA
jgi:hypothetical protein